MLSFIVVYTLLLTIYFKVLQYYHKNVCRLQEIRSEFIFFMAILKHKLEILDLKPLTVKNLIKAILQYFHINFFFFCKYSKIVITLIFNRFYCLHFKITSIFETLIILVKTLFCNVGSSIIKNKKSVSTFSKYKYCLKNEILHISFVLLLKYPSLIFLFVYLYCTFYYFIEYCKSDRFVLTQLLWKDISFIF